MPCFPQHLHDIKYITFLEVHFKMALTLYLRLIAKQVNFVEATKKFVQMSHLFWHMLGFFMILIPVAEILNRL